MFNDEDFDRHFNKIEKQASRTFKFAAVLSTFAFIIGAAFVVAIIWAIIKLVQYFL